MMVYAYQCNSKMKFAPVAYLIKYFSKTNYSHYVIGLTDDYNNIIKVFHSHASGVEGIELKTFKKKYKIYKRFAICETNASDFEKFTAMYTGKKYGFAQNFGLLLKIWGIIKNNPFGKGAKRIICNELIILYLNYRGIASVVDTDELNLKDTEELLLRI